MPTAAALVRPDRVTGASSSWAWRESALEAPDHGLGPALGADLAVESADVGLDRVDAQVQVLGDLLVAQPLADETEHLRLPFGQPVLLTRPRGSPHLRPVPVGDCVAQFHDGLSRMDALQRVD